MKAKRTRFEREMLIMHATTAHCYLTMTYGERNANKTFTLNRAKNTIEYDLNA